MQTPSSSTNFSSNSQLTIQHLSRIIVSLIFVFFISGCGKGGPELAYVTGVILLDGVPAPRAAVIFTPLTGGRPASGGTNEKGEFELYYAGRNKGFPPGEFGVTIDNSQPPGKPAPKPQVPALYRQPGNCTVSVTPGKNQLTIELTAKDPKKQKK